MKNKLYVALLALGLSFGATKAVAIKPSYDTSRPLAGEVIIKASSISNKDPQCLNTLFKVVKDIEVEKLNGSYYPRVGRLGVYYGGLDGTGTQYVNFYLGVPYSYNEALASSKGAADVMGNLNLQKDWANTLSKDCPSLGYVSFGLSQTDWITDFYLDKGTMKYYDPPISPVTGVPLQLQPGDQYK